MQDSDNDFSPVLIDQQIENPDTTLPRGDARLIHDLQAIYELAENAAIERVWTHLAQHHTAEQQFDQPSKQATQRHGTMQQTQRTETQRRNLPRFFTLVAALLVGVVLIGSTVLVFSSIKGESPSTQTGVATSKTTTTPAATATPWNDCDDDSNMADATLCSTHKETILNITKTFGTHKVTFLRAYADTTQLMLVYRDGLASEDATSFMSVAIQQGIVLQGGGSTGYTNPTTHQGYNVISFPTGAVPAGTTELHIQSIVDAFSGKPTPLVFTIPFHTNQKTVTVNQTATSRGISLTLKRVVFTGSTTLFYAGPAPYVNGGFIGIFVKSISINGQVLTYNGSQSDNNVDGNTLLNIAINADLNKPGAWTIQISGNQQKASEVWTWTFHLTVPAN